jgi:hypothetical protein
MDPPAEEITRVLQSAATAFGALPGSGIHFDVGRPERVYSPEGRPAYWLVPGLHQGQIQAVSRILPDGRVATIGLLKAPVADCAAAVTGLSATRVVGVSRDLTAQYPADDISQPMLVHDGPVGREAWLYTVTSAPGTELWIFATAGGTYSRPAGKPLSSDR